MIYKCSCGANIQLDIVPGQSMTIRCPVCGRFETVRA